MAVDWLTFVVDRNRKTVGDLEILSGMVGWLTCGPYLIWPPYLVVFPALSPGSRPRIPPPCQLGGVGNPVPVDPTGDGLAPTFDHFSPSCTKTVNLMPLLCSLVSTVVSIYQAIKVPFSGCLGFP